MLCRRLRNFILQSEELYACVHACFFFAFCVTSQVCVCVCVLCRFMFYLSIVEMTNGLTFWEDK